MKYTYASYQSKDTERPARLAYLGYAEAAGVRPKQWRDLTEHQRMCWRAAAAEVMELSHLEHLFKKEFDE